MKRILIEAEPCAELDALIRRGLARVVVTGGDSAESLITTQVWAQELFFGDEETADPRACARRAG